MNKLKTLALVSLMALSTIANAQSLSSTIGFSSLYIYRGVNYYSQGKSYASQGSPVVQGSLDYANGPLGISLYGTPEDSFDYTAGVLERDTDIISTISLSKVGDDFGCGLATNYYSFTKNPSNNMFEYAVNLTYKKLRFDSSFINNFVGAQTTYYYNQLSFKPMVSDKANLIFHVGYIVFGEGAKVDTSNYFDYKLGVGASYESFNYEISFSNTLLRKSIVTDAISTQDSAVIISISRTLSLL